MLFLQPIKLRMKKIFNFITGNSLGFETEELLNISLLFVAILMSIYVGLFNLIK